MSPAPHAPKPSSARKLRVRRRRRHWWHYVGLRFWFGVGAALFILLMVGLAQIGPRAVAPTPVPLDSREERDTTLPDNRGRDRIEDSRLKVRPEQEAP